MRGQCGGEEGAALGHELLQHAHVGVEREHRAQHVDPAHVEDRVDAARVAWAVARAALEQVPRGDSQMGLRVHGWHEVRREELLRFGLLGAAVRRGQHL